MNTSQVINRSSMLIPISISDLKNNTYIHQISLSFVPQEFCVKSVTYTGSTGIDVLDGKYSIFISSDLPLNTNDNIIAVSSVSTSCPNSCFILNKSKIGSQAKFSLFNMINGVITPINPITLAGGYVYLLLEFIQYKETPNDFKLDKIY